MQTLLLQIEVTDRKADAVLTTLDDLGKLYKQHHCQPDKRVNVAKPVDGCTKLANTFLAASKEACSLLAPVTTCLPKEGLNCCALPYYHATLLETISKSWQHEVFLPSSQRQTLEQWFLGP